MEEKAKTGRHGEGKGSALGGTDADVLGPVGDALGGTVAVVTAVEFREGTSTSSPDSPEDESSSPPKSILSILDMMDRLFGCCEANYKSKNTNLFLVIVL